MNTLYPADKREKHATHRPERPEDHTSDSDTQMRSVPQRLWRSGREFFARNTFAPIWFSRSWSHPFIGYLVATLLQVAAVTVIVLLLQAFPSFHFPEAFILLVVIGGGLYLGRGAERDGNPCGSSLAHISHSAALFLASGGSRGRHD